MSGLANMEVPRVPQQNSPSGVTLEILREQMRGNLTKDEFELMNAAWIADNASQYKPQHFLPLSQQLDSYISNRIAGRMEYDQETSRKLGLWIAAFVTTRTKNRSDWWLLLWASAIAETRAPGVVAQIDLVVKMHTTLLCPIEEFRSAIRVQRMDAEFKQSRERR